MTEKTATPVDEFDNVMEFLTKVRLLQEYYNALSRYGLIEGQQTPLIETALFFTKDAESGNKIVSGSLSIGSKIIITFGSLNRDNNRNGLDQIEDVLERYARSGLNLE